MKNLARPYKWVLFGIACYLLIAIFTAPASLIFSLIKNDGITASNLSGSAWNGEAGSININGFRASDVRWKLKPLSLLTLGAGAEVNAKIPGGSVRSDIKVSFFGKKGRANKLHGVVKLNDLINGLPSVAPLLIDGKLGLQLDEVRWSDNKLEYIHGDISLVNLVETATRTELGNFEMVFAEDQGEVLKGIISDTAAVIKLDGSLKIQKDGNYQFDGLAQPTDDTPGAIVGALQLIGGSKDREGNYTLTLSGSY